jgi:ArsR family metal-binding transcriptional regulator
MNLVSFSPSSRKGKKYEIVILKDNGRTQTIHFGSKTSQTYLDHKDKTKRDNYIARHKVNERWDEVNAGSLSRYILWEGTDLKTNLKAYLKRFGIKNI